MSENAMKINYDFIPQGAVIDFSGDFFIYEDELIVKRWNKKNTIVCDTGGSLGNGIIDHHFHGTKDLCCTAIICEDLLSDKNLFSNLDLNSDEFNLITHIHPDFDSIASCFMVEEFLKNKSLPKYAKELSDYVNEVDSGKLVIDSTQPINPASLVLAISHYVFNSSQDLQTRNVRALQESYNLFYKILELIEKESKSIWSTDLLTNNLDEFEKFKHSITRDYEIYKNTDLSESSYYSIKLLNNHNDTYEYVDLLVTKNPKSNLWKYWSRSDLINSPKKQGFLCTCAFYNTFKKNGRQRAIIATDPNTPYNLKGLGVILEKYEMDALEKHGILKDELNQVKRTGFHRHDPWYDGRSEFNNFTILDSPNHGSLLSEQLILDIILKYEFWVDLGYELENFNTVESIRNLIVGEATDESENLKSHLNYLDSLSSDKLFQVVENINKISFELKCMSVRNEIIADKIKLSRDEIYNAFIIFNAKTKEKNWNNKITGILSNNFPILYLQKWIVTAKELDEEALINSIPKLFRHLNRREIIPLIFSVQSNHFKSFTTLVQSGKFSDLVQALISQKSSKQDIDFYKALIQIVNKIILNYSDYYYKENFPLSSLIAYANCIDDMYTFIMIKNSNFPEKQLLGIVNKYLDAISSNSSIENFREINFNYTDLRNSIKKELFGEENKLIKKMRDDFLVNNHNLVPELKNFLMQDYDSIELKSFIVLINRQEHSKELSENEKEFFGRLKAFLTLRIYEEIFSRSTIVSNLFEINNIPELQISNPELSIFIQLIQILLTNILTNHHTSEEDTKKSLLEAIEKINQLKNINFDNLNINLNDILDDLYQFIKLIHFEINGDNIEIETEIENSLVQYRRVFSEDGLLNKLNSIPLFFRSILEEIFYYYKSYYNQKIELLELTNTAIICNDIRLSEITDHLLEKIVYYDLMSLKENVIDSTQSNNLYYKLLLREKLKVVDRPALDKLNITIRNSFNDSKNKNTIFGQNHTKDNQQISENELFGFYIPSISLFNDSPQLNKQLYLKAYNFIIEKRLESYDFENAKSSLEKISPGFPKWLKILSNVTSIKFLSLGIIGLILLTAAFDNNIYEFDEISFRPLIPYWIKNLIPGLFNSVSISLQLIWTVLIYGTILSAFVIVFYKVFRGIKNKSKKSAYENSVQRISELTEYKKLNLLLLHFLFPLLIVIAEIIHPETLRAFFNIGGSRLIYMGVLAIILVIHSIRKDIQYKNPNRSLGWVKKKASYIFWLYLFQTLVVSILILDLFVKFEVGEEMFTSYKQMTDMGLSKIIEFHFYYFDVVLFPIFTFTLTAASLLFSVFIEKLFSKKKE